MIAPKLVLFLVSVLCLLQMACGLLYGLAPDHLLMKIQRLRLLQKQEEQRRRLLEVAEQELFYDVHQLHKTFDSHRTEGPASNLGQTVADKQKLAPMSPRFISSLRTAMLRSNTSPTFKYSFIG